MILIGIGANLPAAGHTSPRDTCEAAVAVLCDLGVPPARQSRWYKSAPVPISDQPWFINGVCLLETGLPPLELLALLATVEQRFGRVRSLPNAARTLDIDLLAYDDLVENWQAKDTRTLQIPHPRLHQRSFVLFPLKEVAPDWRHPVLDLSVDQMIAELDPSQQTLPDDGPQKSE